eukprot:m.12283 g.12283  ORF g.12283 m.12283 type:complete len:437 (+) comp8025_c0_seq1:63-1373(+)
MMEEEPPTSQPPPTAELEESTPTSSSLSEPQVLDSTPPPTPESHVVSDLTIAVENPQRHGDGMFDSYIVFNVRTQTTRKKFQSSDTSVQRRFSDFVWLHDVLGSENPSYFIPPVPPKHALKTGKFEAAFLETRRAALQRFLHRIVCHPVLSYSDTLRVFLIAKTHEFQTVKKEKGRGMFDKVGESVSLFASKLSIKNPDPRFVKMQAYVQSFETQLKFLSQTAEDSMTDYNETLSVLKELCNCVGALAQSETSLESTLLSFQKTWEAQTNNFEQLTNGAVVSFAEALKEMYLFGDSLKQALARRDAVELEARNIKDSLQARQEERQVAEASEHTMTLGAIFGKKPEQVKMEKLQKIDAQLVTLGAQYEQASDMNEVANHNIMAEMDRWHRQQNKETREVMCSLAEAQHQFFSQTAKDWTSFIASLEEDSETSQQAT